MDFRIKMEDTRFPGHKTPGTSLIEESIVESMNIIKNNTIVLNIQGENPLRPNRLLPAPYPKY